MIPTQDATTGTIPAAMAEDQRAALPPAQGVILWSMRAWVLGLARDTDMTVRIRGAFDGVDAPDAAGDLIAFMEALDAAGTRTIDVERMCNPRLSADERLLLDVFARIAAGNAAAAARVLRGMVTTRGVSASLTHAEAVASELVDAGHLRGDEDTSTRPAVPPESHAVLH